MRFLWYWPHPHRTESAFARGLLRDGDELVVEALSSLRGEYFSRVVSYSVVRDLPDPSRGSSIRNAVIRARRRAALAAGRFDAVVVQTLTYEVDALALRLLRRRTPVVAIVHDINPHRARWGRVAERTLRRLTYCIDIDWIVFHEVLADQLQREHPVTRGRVHVVPIPVTREAVDAGTRHRGTVLFFGSMRQNKGLDVLLEAWPRVAGQGRVLVIAGTGDQVEMDRAKRFAEGRHDVELHLRHIDASEKESLYSRAAVVVLPYTRFDSQSAVLGDAIAFGVPVAATDVGALGETVRTEGLGEVCPPCDAKALALTVDLVLANAGTYDAALSSAVQRHDPQTSGAAVRSVVDLAIVRQRR